MRALAAIFLVVVVCSSGVAAQSLRLPAVIGDHMVVQRDKPAPLWGWAEAGATVTVSMAGQSHETESGDDGRWAVTLEPMDAGGPHTIVIGVGTEQHTLEDVMVGEVWLCSGQSNMDMRLRKMEDAENEVAEATHENLRLFRVERAVADTPQDDLDASWVRCNPSDARDFSAVGYYMGLELLNELDVPVGIIHTAYGGTPVEAWTPHGAMEGDPELQPLLDRHERRIADYEAELAEYEAAQSAMTNNGSPNPGGATLKKPSPPAERYMPAGLYNAMIHPLQPFALRGFAWYQGESNVWRARQYEFTLTAMIEAWRAGWGDEALPFGVVQLPGYVSPPRVPPGTFSWAELRESQLRVAQKLDHVGLIVTTDVGNPTDIHPLAKRPVGQRLAQWALNEAYGRNVVPTGPIYQSHRIEGDRVYLTFDHVGDGLATVESAPPRGFVICGPDQKFRWAVAEIIDDRTIVVSEAKVPEPQAVRYGWDDNPAWTNLVNSANLPASPFRTDDWPGITDDAR